MNGSERMAEGAAGEGAADLAGHIRDARSNENPCEHWVGQGLAVCSPCLRDRLMPHFAAALGTVLSDLVAEGQRLASRRDDLIAQGEDPSHLEVPM